MNKKLDRKTRLQQSRRDVHNAYAYLGRFLSDCLDCRYKRYLREEDLMLDYQRILEDCFGCLSHDGRLQEDLDLYCDKLLSHLKADFPHFSRKRLLVFSYTAAGLPVSLICRLAEISCEGAVYTMRCLMKQEIGVKASPWKEDYLAMLRHEQLPNWGRNAIFAR